MQLTKHGQNELNKEFLFQWLVQHAKQTEWLQRWTDCQFCPYCEPSDDGSHMTDQTEHHPGCAYVTMIAYADSLLVPKVVVPPTPEGATPEQRIAALKDRFAARRGAEAEAATRKLGHFYARQALCKQVAEALAPLAGLDATWGDQGKFWHGRISTIMDENHDPPEITVRIVNSGYGQIAAIISVKFEMLDNHPVAAYFPTPRLVQMGCRAPDVPMSTPGEVLDLVLNALEVAAANEDWSDESDESDSIPF